MAKRVLSIEISRTLVKVCEIDFKAKSSKVYQCFTLKTPSGAYEDGLITETENFGKYLKEKLAERGIKNKQVVFTITSARIASREVFIPFVKEKQIASIVLSNAKDYFPVDISGYQVAHNVLDVVEKDGNKQYKLLVLAAPKPTIESYLNLAKAAGLSVEAIDFSGNSIVPVVKGALDNETTMVIKVDEHASLLTIFKNKVVVMQRNLTQGADVAIETVQEYEAFGSQLTYDDALNMLRGKTLIRKTFDSAAVDEGDDRYDEKYNSARIELTDSLHSLVASIVRVIDYYNSRNSEEPIKKFLLTGFGGDFSGLSKLLSHEIDSKVTVLSHVNGITLDKSLSDGKVSFGEYIACIGAGISPINFAPAELNDKNKKKSGGNIFTKDISELDMGQLSIIVCALGIIIAIAMAAFSLYGYVGAKVENDRLTKRMNDLSAVLLIYNDYTNANTLYNDVVTMYDQTQNANEQIVAFIGELQQKMPSSITINTLIADSETVTIEAYVDSEEAIGGTIEELRKFESIKNVEFTGANLETNDIGSVVWGFTVTGYYAEMPTVGKGSTVENTEEVTE